VNEANSASHALCFEKESKPSELLQQEEFKAEVPIQRMKKKQDMRMKVNQSAESA